jgi:hypothetical protein
MTPAGAVVAAGPIAPWSIDANGDCVPLPVAPADAGGGGGVVAAIGGVSAALISVMRAMAV